MTNKFQPSEDIFDDVEGHGGKFPIEAEDTDVEGHMPFIKRANSEAIDVEGHMPLGKIEDDLPEDVEGHLGGKTVPVEAEDNEKSWQR